MLCKTCNQDKPSGAFYSSRPTCCKECVKAKAHAYRQENLGRVQAYDRARGSEPHRVAARAAYAATPAYAASHDAATAKWRGAHPGRFKAQTKVGNAIRDGKLAPWSVCAIHTCCDKPHAHHPDYTRPLDVVWLCPLHHKQAHAIAEAENFLPA